MVQYAHIQGGGTAIIELVLDLRTINVLGILENDLKKIRTWDCCVFSCDNHSTTCSGDANRTISQRPHAPVQFPTIHHTGAEVAHCGILNRCIVGFGRARVFQAMRCKLYSGYCVIHCGFICMMTSSNGNIFCVKGPLCGEFTGHRWIPCTSSRPLWCHCNVTSGKSHRFQMPRRAVGTETVYTWEGYLKRFPAKESFNKCIESFEHSEAGALP